MEDLFETLDLEHNYPQEIKDVTLQTIKELIAVDYFLNYFHDDPKAVTMFYDKLCESLIPKFISGEELCWCEEGFEKIMIGIGVEYSVGILENLNLIYVFDCQDEKNNKTGEKILVLKK